MATDIFDKYKGEWAIVKVMGSEDTFAGRIVSPTGLPDDADATIALLLGGVKLCPFFDYILQIGQDQNGAWNKNEMCMPHNLCPDIEYEIIVKPSSVVLFKNLPSSERNRLEKVVRYGDDIASKIRAQNSNIQLATSMPTADPRNMGGDRPSILKI